MLLCAALRALLCSFISLICCCAGVDLVDLEVYVKVSSCGYYWGIDHVCAYC